MSESSADRAPDSVEPVLGWRVWALNRDGLLRPIAVADQAWAPGTNEARCHLPHTRHRAPAQNCVCGFNALHRLPEEYRGDPGHAVGAIGAWGEVDLYRTGFRAQFACVLGLLDDAPPASLHDRKLRAAAERYGVPLLPLPELRSHAERHAAPAGAAARGHVPAGGGGDQPLPAGATPAGFEGRGVQISAHLAVDHRGRFMRVGPTPSLAAIASAGIEAAVAPGDDVFDGDPLLVAEAGTSVVLAPSPAAGTVIGVNDAAPAYEEGPAAGGWLVELRLASESLDSSSIAWGRRGAEAYRESVLAAGSDADLLLRCAENPRPPAALLAPAEGRAWLRAFAQQLDTALRADPALCAALRSLGGGVSFDVAGVEELRIAPPRLGAGRWVDTVAAPGVLGEGPADRLRIELGPQALRGYWRGELGLAPDHVSVAAGRNAEEGPRNPLHLRAGDRGRLLLANSLHRRLFAAATEILDGLGDPWFRAGDAVRDPVRNLEVLAGFQPPGNALGGVA